MKKILQWLAVVVFACLVFIPGIAQAQTTSTPATGDWDYAISAITALCGAFVGGFLVYVGLELGQKEH